MKKNKMMRLASVLLVCVLLTTSVIGGTFAKYVTVDSGADKATVAKWGVSVTLEDDMGLFKTSYDTDDKNATVISNSNAGDNSDNRVAPGTKGSMTFSISGKPEVETKVTVTATGSPIKLDADTYTLPAGEFADAETSVTIPTGKTYEPIKFYFGTKVAADLAPTEYTMTHSELLDALNSEVTFDPNTDLSKEYGTYTIAWMWAFEDTTYADASFDGTAPTGASVVDFLDTYLGNEATLQTETLNLTIRIEQVD